MMNEKIERYQIESLVDEGAINALVLAQIEGTVTGAARRIGVERSVVVRWIDGLERKLEALLYSADVGSAPSFHLTPAGGALFAALERNGDLPPDYKEQIAAKYPLRTAVFAWREGTLHKTSIGICGLMVARSMFALSVTFLSLYYCLFLLVTRGINAITAIT